MGCSDSKEGEAAQQQQQQQGRGVSGSRPTRGGSPPPPSNALLEAPLTPPSQRQRSRGTSRGASRGGGGAHPPRIVGVGHSSEPSSPAVSPSPNGASKRPAKSAGLSPRSPHSLRGGSRGSGGGGSELPAKSPPAKQNGLNLSRQSSYTKSQNPPPPSGYPPPPHDVAVPSPSGSPTSPQSDERDDVPGFDGTLPPQPSAAALREPQPSVASTTASARQQRSMRHATATEENTWDPDGISGGFRHPPPASHSAAAAPLESSAGLGGRGASQPTHAADGAPAPQPMFDDAVYGHLSGPHASRPPAAGPDANADGGGTPLGLVFDAALARSDARNEVLMAPLPSPSLATSKAEAAGGGGRPVLMEKEHSFVKPRAPSSRGDTHSAVNSWERGTTLHHQQQPTPQLVASSTHSVNAKYNQFASYVDGAPGEPGVGSSRQQPSRASASRQSQRSSRHDQRRQQQMQRPLPAVSDTASQSSSPPRSDGPSPTGVALPQHRGQRTEQARRQPRAPAAAADERPDAAGLALALPTSLPTSVERPTDLMPSYAALNIAPAASDPPSRPPSVVTSARDARAYGAGSRAGGVDRQAPREGSVFGHASDAFHGGGAGGAGRSQQPQVAGSASGAWSPQPPPSEGGRSSQKHVARPADEHALSPAGSEYSVRRQQREPYLSCVPCSVATTVRGCTETMYKGTRQVVACVPVEYSDVAQPSPVGERSHAPRTYTS